jgi:hypothetical protein
MDQYMTDNIAWLRTVGQLGAGCAHQLTVRVNHMVDSNGSSRLSSSNGAVAIALLDRISPRTVAVSWSDPQRCKYGEQIWRLATARRSGICALSGQRIDAGDAVYRPSKSASPPANAAAMMLANAIDRAHASNPRLEAPVIDDDLWALIEPLLSQPRPRGKNDPAARAPPIARRSTASCS